MEYDRSSLPFGSRFHLVAAALYAGVVLVGKGLQSVKPEIVTFIQCAVGILTLPIIDSAILHTSIELRQWGWLSGLGVVHTALVYALIYHALPELKSSTIAILTFIYPASAIFLTRGERQIGMSLISWNRHPLFRGSGSLEGGSCL